MVQMQYLTRRQLFNGSPESVILDKGVCFHLLWESVGRQDDGLPRALCRS
jgi:hypothetical protein